MSIISEYPIDATPQLADKAIGTSLTGPPDNTTVNFTFQSILNLFLPEINAQITLQKVLDAGNSASEDINLDGNIAVKGYIYSENIRVYNDLFVDNSIVTVQDIHSNGILIGRGSNDIATNTRVGFDSLISATTGGFNTALGYNTLKLNTIGTFNTAIGSLSLISNTTGSSNTAIGTSSLESNTTGSNNIAIGLNSLQFNTTGVDNTAIGSQSLRNNITGSSNIAIGYAANVEVGVSNSIVIGVNVTAALSNTVTIGNNAILKTFLKGTINTANLPITSIGLVSGDLWRNGNVVNIIP